MKPNRTDLDSSTVKSLKSFRSLPLIQLDVKEFELPMSVVETLLEVTTRNLREGKPGRDMTRRLAGQIRSGRQLDILADLPLSTVQYFEAACRLYRSQFQVNRDITSTQLRVTESWLIEQREGDYNPAHKHACALAGVCYLKVPPSLSKSSGDVVYDFTPGLSLDGAIQFIPGFNLPLDADARPILTLFPKPGRLYVFPGWLVHSVAPFRGKGVRLSVSFNAE